MEAAASAANTLASMAATMGGYRRRADEWALQEKVTAKELEQIDQQIAAAEIRVAIAQNELANHDKQIANAEAIQEFLRGKYTNQELYGWMLSQISTVFFQSYKLAYDVAKRAEKSYRFERGLTSSNFIQFGYWDNLRKGLLSGERLSLDLKRLEAAYLDQNKREYEITKFVSLVMVAPLALVALKETGTCEVSLPEALFDTDYPGHYMRRIKSVNLTIPCVVGPYTSINCTLTLLSNKVRTSTNSQPQYSEDAEGGDQRFVSNWGAVQAIATSHARNDSGMFELNFRDERYLPFEGAGVISRWRIDLPKDCNAFEFDTISDVIIAINYTAREGGDLLRSAARTALVSENTQDLLRMFSAKHEFSNEWYRFLHPTDAASVHTLTLDLTSERFPFQLKGKHIELNSAQLFLKLKELITVNGNEKSVNYEDANPLEFTLKRIEGSDFSASFRQADNPFPNQLLPYARAFTDQQESLGTWILEVTEEQARKAPSDLHQSAVINGVTHHRLNPGAFDDILLVFTYSVI
jgi:Tc toxin complex TcA C-terminal TcB-binding domain